MNSGKSHIEMSLDEYIALRNVKADILDSSTNESQFKAERRQKHDAASEDENNEDDEMLDISSSTSQIIPNTSLDRDYIDNRDYVAFDGNQTEYLNQQVRDKNHFDLRHKIQEKLITPDSGYGEDVQANADEFAGMPAQTSRKAKRNRHNRWRKRKQNQQQGRSTNQNQAQDRTMRQNQAQYQFMRQNQQHNNYDARKKLNNRNGGNSHNLPNSTPATIDMETMRKMRIVADTKKINPQNRNAAHGNLTPAAIASLDNSSYGQQSAPSVISTTSNTGNDIQSLLGVNGNVNGMKVSELASRFIDFLQTGSQQTVHKPVYDMVIQKEIHTLQGKQFRYTKPGGEIVTGDGPGLNCKITPATSGISLNCRFL